MNWNDELIKKGILEVVKYIGENRMPTACEIRDYHKNCKLVGAISNRGGFMVWADKLNLPMKDGDVMLGLKYEIYTKDLLEKKGFECVHTGTKFPYDLLVNDKVKVDVKVSHLVSAGEGYSYTFKIAKNIPKCDMYIAHCLDKDESVAKTYIIPAHRLRNQGQLSIGKDNSIYDIYLNRWELIERFNDSLMKLEE